MTDYNHRAVILKQPTVYENREVVVRNNVRKRYGNFSAGLISIQRSPL